jgi:hypothetical protein
MLRTSTGFTDKRKHLKGMTDDGEQLTTTISKTANNAKNFDGSHVD